MKKLALLWKFGADSFRWSWETEQNVQFWSFIGLLPLFMIVTKQQALFWKFGADLFRWSQETEQKYAFPYFITLHCVLSVHSQFNGLFVRCAINPTAFLLLVINKKSKFLQHYSLFFSLLAVQSITKILVQLRNNNGNITHEQDAYEIYRCSRHSNGDCPTVTKGGSLHATSSQRRTE